MVSPLLLTGRALSRVSADVLDPIRGSGRLAVLHLVDSIGSGMFMAGSVAYFTLGAGLNAGTVGLGMSAAGLAGFVSSPLVGRLVDRFGPHRVLLCVFLCLAVCFLLYPLIDSPVSLVLLMAVVGGLDFGGAPVFGVLVMDAVPEESRVETRSSLRSISNLGASAGALLAAGLLAAGSGDSLELIPILNAVTYLASAFLVLLLPSVQRRTAAPISGRRFAALTDRPFLAVVALSAFLALHSAILLVGLPLWLLNRDDVPPAVVPLILVVNTALVVLLQVRIARGADDVSGAARLGRLSGGVSLMACLVLAILGHGALWLFLLAAIIGTVLLTVSELCQSASAFGLSFGLADHDRRGEYLGAFNLHLVAQAVAGPVLVSWLLSTLGVWGWLVLAVLFAGSGIALIPAAQASTARLYAHDPAGETASTRPLQA